MQRYQMYIDGQHVDPASGAWLETYNPYTGEPWGRDRSRQR
jgi:aldehyde dehydrogenase (NAD+)